MHIQISKLQILKVAGLAAMPWLLLWTLLLYGGFPLQLFTLNPQGGDQLGYFRIIRDFVEKTFAFGKYGYFIESEITAKIGSFGPHSPLYTIVYGIFGKIIGGWRPYDILLVNSCLLSASLILLQTVLSLRCRQIVLLIVFFGAFFPFIQMFISGMMETFQYFLVTFYVSTFLWWTKTRTKKAIILLAFSILICSLCRITYLLLALPLLITFLSERKIKYCFYSIIYCLGVALLCVLVLNKFVCPYPMGFLHKYLALLSEGEVQNAFALQFELFKSNISVFFSGDTKEVLLRVFYLMVTAFLFVQAFFKNKVMLWILTLILFLAATSVLFFYDIQSWRGYRVLAPFLGLAVLVLICENYQKIASFFILVMVLFSLLLPNYLQESIRSHFKQAYDQPELSEQLDKISWVETSNAWANTVACEEFSHLQAFTLAPGLGIVWIVKPNNLVKIRKPNYLLIKKETASSGLHENYNLISENSIWSLFIKKDITLQ